jgi:hypothetical protein
LGWITFLSDFPEEEAILGRLVVGYGELEFEVLNCLAVVLGDVPTATRVLFRTRGEEQRLQVADALLREPFSSNNLGDTYCSAFADMMHCRKVKNQYAHTHWFSRASGLAFIDLEATAKKSGKSVTYLPIDLELVKEQEDFFIYTGGCLAYLWRELKFRLDPVATHTWKLPKKIPQVRRHNGTA